MESTEYFLREHVFFCVSGTFCLFLDLKADRYLLHRNTYFELLAPHLHGWPISAAIGARDETALTPEALSLARELLSKEILSENAMACKGPFRQPGNSPRSLGLLSVSRHRFSTT